MSEPVEVGQTNTEKAIKQLIRLNENLERQAQRSSRAYLLVPLIGSLVVFVGIEFGRARIISGAREAGREAGRAASAQAARTFNETFDLANVPSDALNRFLCSQELPRRVEEDYRRELKCKRFDPPTTTTTTTTMPAESQTAQGG